MDPFKLGLRNLVGIAVPGGVIVLAVFYIALNAAVVLDWKLAPFKDLQWLLVAAALLLSYLLGNTLRLNSADDLDKLSGEALKEQYIAEKYFDNSDEERFKELKSQLEKRHELGSFVEEFDRWRRSPEGSPQESPDQAAKIFDLEHLRGGEGLIRVHHEYTAPDVGVLEKLKAHLLSRHDQKLGPFGQGFDRWLWSTESFPYPGWELRKLVLYHPKEMVRFFNNEHDDYLEILARIAKLDSRKEFINYCKTATFSRSKGGEGGLAEEIGYAEAIVRFFAGTYFGFQYSALLIAASQLWLVGAVYLRARGVVALQVLGVCLAIAILMIVARTRVDVRPVKPKSKIIFEWLRYLSVEWLLYPPAEWTLYLAAAITSVAPFFQTLWSRSTKAGWIVMIDPTLLTSFLVSGFIMLTMYRGRGLITKRFRLLRIKEVDTVWRHFT